MIKNKVFNFFQKYFSEYLFGFDKSQLEVAVLKGHIDLKDVNVKPDKANFIVNSLGLPIALKAGMIGKLQIKYHLMSWSTNPLEIIINDLHLILGPNLMNISNDDSYIEDEDEEYDEENCFNIFEHHLRFNSRMSSPWKNRMDGKKPLSPKKSKINKNFSKILQNIKVQITGVHIRYEDDYFASDNPYSWGIVCDNISWFTSDVQWHFQTLQHKKFEKVPPPQNEKQNLIIKEIKISNFRMYWSSMSEMYIPTSLWESTKNLEFQIFDAFPQDDLRRLMHSYFTEQYLIAPFDVFINFAYNSRENALEEANEFGRPKLKMEILLTKLTLKMSPLMMGDLIQFLDTINNFYISNEVKTYRPARKPITQDSPNISAALLRKRKLIVRDWFFFVVWANRIKKLFKQAKKDDDQKKKEKLEQLMKKYENMMKNVEDPITKSNGHSKQVSSNNNPERLETEGSFRDSDANKKYLDSYLQNYIKSYQENVQAQEQTKKENSCKAFWGSNITIRIQEINLNLFGENEEKIVVDKEKKPMFLYQMISPVFDFKILQEYRETNILFTDIRLYTFICGLSEAAQNSAEQLTPRASNLANISGVKEKIMKEKSNINPLTYNSLQHHQPTNSLINATPAMRINEGMRNTPSYQVSSNSISTHHYPINSIPASKIAITGPSNLTPSRPPNSKPPPKEEKDESSFFTTLKNKFFGGSAQKSTPQNITRDKFQQGYNTNSSQRTQGRDHTDSFKLIPSMQSNHTPIIGYNPSQKQSNNTVDQYAYLRQKIINEKTSSNVIKNYNSIHHQQNLRVPPIQTPTSHKEEFKHYSPYKSKITNYSLQESSRASFKKESPQELKKLSRASKTDSGQIYTQRCIFNISSSEISKEACKVKIVRQFSLRNEKEEKSHLFISLGKVRGEFFPNVAQLGSEMLISYKTLHFFRDLSILSMFKQKIRKKIAPYLSIKQMKQFYSKLLQKQKKEDELSQENIDFKNKKRDEDIDEDEGVKVIDIHSSLQNSNLNKKIAPKNEPKSEFYKLMKKINGNIEGKDIHFRLDVDQWDFALYEDLKTKDGISLQTQPFMQLHSPQNTILFQNQSNQCTISALGFKLQTKYSFPILYMFFSSIKGSCTAFTENEFMKKYKNIYEKLEAKISRQRNIKFSKTKALMLAINRKPDTKLERRQTTKPSALRNNFAKKPENLHFAKQYTTVEGIGINRKETTPMLSDSLAEIHEKYPIQALKEETESILKFNQKEQLGNSNVPIKNHDNDNSSNVGSFISNESSIKDESQCIHSFQSSSINSTSNELKKLNQDNERLKGHHLIHKSSQNLKNKKLSSKLFEIEIPRNEPKSINQMIEEKNRNAIKKNEVHTTQKDIIELFNKVKNKTKMEKENIEENKEESRDVSSLSETDEEKIFKAKKNKNHHSSSKKKTHKTPHKHRHKHNRKSHEGSRKTSEVKKAKKRHHQEFVDETESDLENSVDPEELDESKAIHSHLKGFDIKSKYKKIAEGGMKRLNSKNHNY